MRYCVIGGCGYVGLRLAYKLLEGGGHEVVLFDRCLPRMGCMGGEVDSYEPCAPTRAECFTGDIGSQYEAVSDAIRGAEVVFHLASFGMSGAESTQHQLIRQVNVEGTKNVIRACQEHRVKALVYVSTVNVVFAGQTIENGDESLPYISDVGGGDEYSRSKMRAERLVLEASTADLCTFSLRPGGIWGPGESRHFPRFLSAVESGLYQFTFDMPGSLVDWVFVDNLVHSLILASRALLSTEGSRGSNRRAFFITDGHPINNSDFMNSLISGLGYDSPSIKVPFILILRLAYLLELLSFILRQIGFASTPFLSRAEVRKCGTCHFFNIELARSVLGYDPPISYDEGMRRTIAWFNDHGYRRRSNNTSRWILLLGLSFLVLVVIAILVLHA
jgi:nucleoside-diphosphate-sugar epimerase